MIPALSNRQKFPNTGDVFRGTRRSTLPKLMPVPSCYYPDLSHQTLPSPNIRKEDHAPTQSYSSHGPGFLLAGGILDQSSLISSTSVSLFTKADNKKLSLAEGLEGGSAGVCTRRPVQKRPWPSPSLSQPGYCPSSMHRAFFEGTVICWALITAPQGLPPSSLTES